MSDIKDQPLPRKNASRPIWELVIEDMRKADRGERHLVFRQACEEGMDAWVFYAHALDLLRDIAICGRRSAEPTPTPCAWKFCARATNGAHISRGML